MTPLIVKADLKHLTYVYTGGESDFNVLLNYGGKMELTGTSGYLGHVEAELTSLSTDSKQQTATF